MTMEGGAGVVPVMDLNRNNYGDGFGYGGGAWFMWIIVLFALMGGWGNNRNNGLESALTRSDLANGFDAQDIKNGIRGVQNGLCDGFYAQNTTMLNGFSTIGAAIAENRFAAQQCAVKLIAILMQYVQKIIVIPARLPMLFMQRAKLPAH